MGGRGGSSGLSGGGGIGKLPELQGSEKQVAWAKDIRNSVIQKYTYENLMNDSEKLSSSKIVLYLESMTGNDVISAHENGKIYKREEMVGNIRKKYVKENPAPPYGSKEREEYTRKFKNEMKKVEDNYKKWLYDQFKKMLKTQKSAKWWIDNR